MKYNGELNVAVGLSARSKLWKNKTFTWAEFVQRLSECHNTPETFKEYMAANKAEQLKIKDVGGYVGGYLRNGRRKPENVVTRQVITLDIDFAHLDFWEDFILQFDNAAILHSTHKHHKDSPRFRLILPINREVTPDEYVAISRRVAGFMDIELFDNTTFETNRLMFWPSAPKDVSYYYRFQDGPWIDADAILMTYKDWKDTSLWPTADKKFQEIKTSAAKQEDPENKKGIIGAFCRTYSISQVIDKYLSDVYETTATEDRYTYKQGTAAAGLILYDDKFAYSHHGTDPCGGKLSNSFDLVRIHKFGHLDMEQSSRKSFKAMEDLAREDKQVKKIVASEHFAEAKYEFAEEDDFDEEVIDWMSEMEVDSKNRYLSSANNINLIFANDIRLKGLFRRNDFDNKLHTMGTLPWRKVTRPEPIRDVDFSGVRNYVESIYGITGSQKIDDVLKLESERNSFHPVKKYLNGLKWDGEKRIDTLLQNLFGVAPNAYTNEALRKTLCGAVARVYEPGCKFDLVLTMVSTQQGTGKSSFWRALGRQWFSDSFSKLEGNAAFEQLHGAWIIEIAELKGMRKADIETIKHFISKQDDSFRPAFGRVVETFRRQCIFVATTNETEFLRDPSGNRRFMPINVHDVKLMDNPQLKKFLEDDEEIGQVWAEAVHLYKKGEPIYLSKEAEKIAEHEQRSHSESDHRRGIIEEYLNTPLPDNWDGMDVFDRRSYLADPLSHNGITTKDHVCTAEIWCECFGKEKTDMDRYKTREINDILRCLPGWEASKSTKHFKLYGTQKYYERSLL